jgi:hypothetical protein
MYGILDVLIPGLAILTLFFLGSTEYYDESETSGSAEDDATIWTREDGTKVGVSALTNKHESARLIL